MQFSEARDLSALPAPLADIKLLRTNDAVVHNYKTSIQHWQLRDLVHCPDNDNEVYFVYQNNVRKLNRQRNQVSTVLALDYAPTSMAVGLGYVCAGGQISQFCVKELATDKICFQGPVGGSINNSIHLCNMSGEPRVLVSNNDDTVKVFSLPSVTRVATIMCPVAINYASTSPDGKHMVAVGDSTDVFLFETEQGFRRVAKMSEAKDAGFGCAWSQSSLMFATASQDGLVCVWDLRMRKLLARLHAKQTVSIKKACRSVKFSRHPMDVLLFTEHQSYIHAVDARTFADEQVIRATAEGRDQHISGLAISPESSVVYVGLEDFIAEYHVDTLTRRTFYEGSLI